MHWANEEQQSWMRYLNSLPPEQRCASGWHVLEKEKCDCAQVYGFATLAERNAAAGAQPRQESGKMSSSEAAHRDDAGLR